MCEVLEEIEESEIRIEENGFKHLTALGYLEWKLGKETISYGNSDDE